MGPSHLILPNSKHLLNELINWESINMKESLFLSWFHEYYSFNKRGNSERPKGLQHSLWGPWITTAFQASQSQLDPIPSIPNL